MELLEGVRVIGAADRGRLLLYEGTTQMGNAFVPRVPGRALTDEEYATLCRLPSDLNTRGFVAVVPVPDKIRKAFLSSRVAQGNQAQDMAELVAHAQKFASAFVEDCPHHQLKPLGISVRRAGLLTSTFDHPNGCFLGLHIDSFYMAPLEDRTSSPNRLCINLTSEPRRLLFLNLSLVQCRDLLVASGYEDTLLTEPRTVGLPRLFMKQVPDYPVIEIRIDPDEAYVAPTENMIHDSSTFRRRERDVFYTFLGEFSLRRVLERVDRPVEVAS